MVWFSHSHRLIRVRPCTTIEPFRLVVRAGSRSGVSLRPLNALHLDIAAQILRGQCALPTVLNMLFSQVHS